MGAKGISRSTATGGRVSLAKVKGRGVSSNPYAPIFRPKRVAKPKEK